MNTSAFFDTYFTKSQQLICNAEKKLQVQEQLIKLIEESKAKAPEHASFFNGEMAFYSSNFSHALKHYLLSKELPLQKLFCYRASAYASKEAGEIAKSRDFAKKALTIYPQDYPSLILLAEIDPEYKENPLIKYLEDQRSLVEASDTYEDPMLPDNMLNLEKNSLSSSQKLMERLHNQPIMERFSSKAVEREEAPIPAMIQVDLIDHRVKAFQQQREQALQHYREHLTSRQEPFDNTLFILNGWRHNLKTANPFPLTKNSRASSGGFFIRWNGKGIVINPGKHFLEDFHAQGLHICDIDVVIVTRDHLDAHADIQEIYTLNGELNKESSTIHVINYYLAQKAYQALTSTLKPHFKQEKNSVHCLELFVDSPDSEKIEIADKILLHYFSSVSPLAHTLSKHESPNNLAIVLELQPAGEATQGISVGYISDAPWTPSLAKHFHQTDLLIAGFGNTNQHDYQQQKYNENCLGFFGISTLIKEVNPKLLLCAEFSGLDGDIRLEVTKLLRQQPAENPRTILPVDIGMMVNLKRYQVQCSITKSWVDATHIKVVRSDDNFGTLRYISPQCLN